MSKYTKKTLAVALVAALTIPAAAFAFQLQTDGDQTPEAIASQLGLEVTMSEPVEFVTQIRDVIIGRTTGFQVLVTLEDGAQFNGAPTLTAGDGLTGGWDVQLAAGGTDGSIDAQFTVSPTAPASTVSEGVILQFAELALQNVRTTGTTRLSVQLRDPVSGAQLHAATREIISRNNGLEISCEPTVNPDRIDVGGENPKALFVEYQGASGYPIGEGSQTTTDLGQIDFAATSGFSFTDETTLNSQIAGNFAGFTNVFLSVDGEGGTCSNEVAAYVINDAGTLATLEDDGVFEGAGGTATLCVTVDGETPIAAQTFQVTNGVDGNWSASACPVAPLQYNGSVVKVYHVNPAGNTTAQSFVRVMNPSLSAGRVTITGIDDAGNTSQGAVSFDLPSRGSMQINSEDLENGNAGKGLTGSLGDGVGKWRLEVTGEFQGMLVQGLNRNTTNGTVTNLTDADGEFEQRLLHEGGGF
ncbi:hypothetical protein CNR27_14840 [Luteimonas chenhongjianii]|uniref:Adhesin n=1 Tax=Luteimonas chenhongjianii TaxID=2006110 RepID=A0A290XHJ6_9GAMM|nr:hypothetical protein [Luteimonas chenhongjianii]ATD68553.1 hypothetical protein CNR27_14840 [Luteimonas chenhongjianii]